MSNTWNMLDPVEDSQVPVEDSQVQDSQLQDSQDAMEPVEVRREEKKRPQLQPPAEYSGPCKWKVGIPNFITADLTKIAQMMLADPDANHEAPQVTITMPLRTFADNKPKRGRIAYDTDPDKVKEGRPIFIGKQWSHGEYFLAVWTRKFKEGSSASSNGDKVKEGSS